LKRLRRHDVGKRRFVRSSRSVSLPSQTSTIESTLQTSLSCLPPTTPFPKDLPLSRSRPSPPARLLVPASSLSDVSPLPSLRLLPCPSETLTDTRLGYLSLGVDYVTTAKGILKNASIRGDASGGGPAAGEPSPDQDFSSSTVPPSSAAMDTSTGTSSGQNGQSVSPPSPLSQETRAR
jgi:hypothetical protein